MALGVFVSVATAGPDVTVRSANSILFILLTL
jgi:hypothetical protein